MATASPACLLVLGFAADHSCLAVLHAWHLEDLRAHPAGPAPTPIQPRSKPGWKGFRKRTPSRDWPCSASSVRMTGTWLSLALAQIRLSHSESWWVTAPRQP